jgi:hypothetical protein
MPTTSTAVASLSSELILCMLVSAENIYYVNMYYIPAKTAGTDEALLLMTTDA